MTTLGEVVDKGLAAEAARQKLEADGCCIDTEPFPPCEFVGTIGPGDKRGCSFLDATPTAGECHANREAGVCVAPEPADGAMPLGYYGRGPWRAIVLNWPGKDMPVQTAKSMRALGWDVLELRRGGDADWKDNCIDAIKRLRPQLLITVQRFYEGQFAGEIGEACKRYNVAMLVMDFGVAAGQAHYGVSIFDPAGDNHTSSLAYRFDEIESDPAEAEWIDWALPQVDALAVTIRERAAACGADLLEKYGLDKLGEFAFIILQKAGDAVLRYDSEYRAPRAFAVDAAKRCKALGVRPVVKPHPFDHWKDDPIPGAVVLPKMGGEENHQVLSWLLVNASHVVAVNSTAIYQAMAVGTPVTCLGKGWFSGNGIAHEQCDTPLRKFTLPDTHDSERCKRFVALMMSRQLTDAQCKQPGQVEAMLRRFERLQEQGRSAITTVYAPDKSLEAVAKRSLLATRAAMTGPIVAATDVGQPGFETWLAAKDMTCVRIGTGKPPRMNQLIGMALDHCQGDLVWTIESDVFVSRDVLDRAEAVMRDLPADVASLSLETVDEDGQRNFPSSLDIPKRTRAAGDLLEVIEAAGRKPYNCFCATLWRYHALARVDWDKCRPLLKCDIDAGAQLSEQGWRHMVAPGLDAIHYPHTFTGRKAPTLPPQIAKPLVSVLALTCGRLQTTKRWLPDAIQSLGYMNIELLVWDNGSADGTREWLAAQPWRCVLHPINIGKKALPEALKLLSGDYLLEIDDDVELPKDALKRLLATYRAKPGIPLGPVALDYVWQFNHKPFSENWKWDDEALTDCGDPLLLQSPDAEKGAKASGACRLTPMPLARSWKVPGHYAMDTPFAQQSARAGYWVGCLKGEPFVHHCGRRTRKTVNGPVFHGGWKEQ